MRMIPVILAILCLSGGAHASGQLPDGTALRDASDEAIEAVRQDAAAPAATRAAADREMMVRIRHRYSNGSIRTKDGGFLSYSYGGNYK